MAITIVGLGPSGLDTVDRATLDLLDDATIVVVRTREHPAARELAQRRAVLFCDDLYERFPEFDDVYAAIADRVLREADAADVVYAVPGSPLVGERSVAMVRTAAAVRGHDVSVSAATSFLDLVYGAVAIDPIVDGVQVVDARDLPDPLPFHLPTIVTQVDSALTAGALAIALGRTLEDDAEIILLDRLGDPDEVVRRITVAGLATCVGGPRTTVFVPATRAGLLGLIATNRELRGACPWDRQQTHHSLLTHLVEEAYETADALTRLPVDAPRGQIDFGAYAEVEDELGDLLLQVVFHATLAAETGAFDIDEVAELNRRKLVRRHPHVFGDVDVDGADQVIANWERIKGDEKARDSLMDDVPIGMPAIGRAMKVQKRAASAGFDWSTGHEVIEVVRGEIDELEDAVTSEDRADIASEIGDVLFSTVNLARHLGVDPEIALRGSVDRFMLRFRAVETELATSEIDLAEASADQLDQAWERAKRSTTHHRESSSQ